MAEKIKKAVLTAGEAVCRWWKSVYMRERPDKRRLNLLGGAGKHVEACLSGRVDRESSFTAVEALCGW